MRQDSPILRAFALVLFLGLVAGATAVAYDVIERPGLPVQANPVIANRTTGPGNMVAFPIAVSSLQGEPVTVSTRVGASGGLSAEAPSTVEAPPGNGTGFWVNVTVPEDVESGTYDVSLVLAAQGASRTLTLPVRVEEPLEVVDRGETARVTYVGRFPNGTLFATNVEAVDKSPLPRHPRYSSPSYGPIQVPTGPDASFIEGFRDGIVGVGVGHDVTLTLPPSEAYGNATERVEEPRTEQIDRVLEERRVFNISRQRLAQQGFVNESSEEGDVITVGPPDRQRHYIITFLNETRVELTADVEEGDTWTHYQQWPGSSVAVDVNETRIRYRVDPPVEVGEKFTWYDYWPNATVITEIGEENITLRHTPEVGSTYTKQVQRQGSVEHTVVAVREDVIVAERRNPAPLAGQTIVFDVHVISSS